LDIWLSQAAASGMPEFEHSAKSLRSDYQAVQAALILPWSNGQEVNCLKLIKRQMYGRAEFDLLHQRVIGLILFLAFTELAEEPLSGVN